MLSGWQIIFHFNVFIIGTFIAVTTSVHALADYGDIVQITLLGEELSTDNRVRRAADSTLADQLSFSIPVSGDDVVLRLRKSRLLPTVTSDAQSTKAANRVSDNAAVYTDSSHGSAMIVKKINGGYGLEGSFIHNNREWSLEPTLSPFSKDGKRRNDIHQISTMNARNATISFIDDTVLDTEDRPELVNKQKGKGNGYKLKQQSETRAKESHRQKRDVTQHVIEIALVVDYEDYSKWVSHVGTENALTTMRRWYTYVAESINVRYQTIKDPDIAVSTKVTVLKILTNPADADFISSLANANGEFRGSDGLTAFRKWYLMQTDIPLSDHYMLITGFDITGSSGIAISSRACTEFGVSISENSFTGSLGGVAAHELGHSLSAIHDMNTVGQNACTDSNQYVMSTVFTTPVKAGNDGNPWRFSLCSVNSIKAYLGRVSCTLPEHTSATTELPAPVRGERAGQVLSRNEQCVLSFRDSRSSFCRDVQEQNGGLDSLCGGMYCSIPNDWLGSCQTTVPQEFTSCGIDKWCVTGQCVAIDEQSSTYTATPTTTLTSQSLTGATITPMTDASSSSTSATSTNQTSSASPVQTTAATGDSTTVGLIQTTADQENTTISETPTFRPNTVTMTNGLSSTPTTNIPATDRTTFEPKTTPRPTSSTTTELMTICENEGGVPNISRCHFLIFLRMGTEWWNCVQRELRCQRRRRPVGVRRARVYVRRYRLRWSNKD